MKYSSAIVLALAAFLQAGLAHAQTGGTVTAGGATITNPDATTTVITQTTDKAIIQWTNFSIDAGSLVQFLQPGSGSVVLNRVVGADPSVILGSLQANGNVFLLNGNGIVFGAGSQVNVGGLVASTLSLEDSKFLNGQYEFKQDPGLPLSYVINQGSISATGFVALAAPLVENGGAISAPGGSIYLLGASEVLLDISGDRLISYSIGTQAGGTVVIPTQYLSDPVKAVVNFAGVVEAGSVVENGGTTHLVGAEGLVVNTGAVTTSGGTIGQLGASILDSSMGTATFLSSEVRSDGTAANPSAGTVKILSDRNTYFRGYASAEGYGGGTGGFVEVSAGQTLYYFGWASASSQSGTGGTILIDPTYLNITNGATPGSQDAAISDFTILTGDPNNGANTLSEAALEALAGTSNLTIQATDYIVLSSLTTDGTLALKAGAGYTVSFLTTNTASSGIYFSTNTNTITTGGGNLSFTSANYLSLGNLNSAGGSITLLANNYVTVGTITATGNLLNIRADNDSNATGYITQIAGRTWTALSIALRAAQGISQSYGGNSSVYVYTTNLQIANGVSPYTTQGSTLYYVNVYNYQPTVITDLLGLGFGVRNHSQGGYSTYLYATGNMTLNASIFTPYPTHYLYIYALSSGSLIDDGNQATFIQNPSYTYLYAQTGSIGSVGAGAAYFNPFIDVSYTSGYTSYVYCYSLNNIAVSFVNYAPTVYTSYFGGTWNPTATGAQVHCANLVGDLQQNTTLWTSSNDNVSLYATGNLYNSSNIGSSGLLPNIQYHADGFVYMTGGTVYSTSTTQIYADSNAAMFAGNPYIVSDGSGSFSMSGGSLAGTGSLYISSVGGLTVTAGTVTAPNVKLDNRTSGNIAWSDTGASVMTLTNLGVGNAVNNPVGSVSITHSGGITVAANISSFAGTTTTLWSTGGALTRTGGTVTATSLVLRAATGITFSGFVATNLQLQVSGSGAIAVTGTGALNLTDIAGLGYAVSDTGGATTITTTGNITVAGSVTCTGQTCTLTTTGGSITQSAGTITATTLNLNAATGISAPTVTITNLSAVNSTSGNVTVTSAGAMTLVNVSAAGGGTITLTGTSLGDDGSQATMITTTGTISLTATTGSIGSYGGTNFNGFVDVASGFGTLNASAAQDLYISQTGGAASLSTSQVGNFDATGAGRTQGLVNLVGDLVVNDAEFAGLDDSILLGASGNLTVNGGMSVTSTAANVGLYAAGNLTTGGTLSAGTTLTLSADATQMGSDGAGALTQTGGTITATNLVALGATGINLTSTTVSTLQAANSTSGALSVTNTASLTILDVSAGGGGTISLSAPSLLDDSLQTTMITTTGVINLTASAGSIGTFNGTVYDTLVDVASGFTTLNATATGDLYVSQVGTAAGLLSSQIGNFDSTAAGGTQLLANLVGDLTVNDAEFTGLNDDLLLGASGNLVLSSAVSAAGRTITLAAGGSVSLGASATAATLDLRADVDVNGTGVITQSAGTLTATDLILSSAQGITLNGVAATNLQATNTTSGSITIGATGALALDDLGAGYAVLNSAGAVSVSTTGNLSVGAAVTGTDVTLSSAGGSLTQAGGTVAASGTVALNSATGMTFSSVAAASLTATNSGAGTIDLSISGPVALGAVTNNGGSISISSSGDLGLSSAITAGGDVTISVGGLLTQDVGADITAGGNASITSGGDFLMGLVTAGTATINSGGSILDNNVDSLNLVTSGNASMDAIGTVGTDADFLEVQIGGVLNVGAGGLINGVSINLGGTTGNNDINVTHSPPNGLVKWNGVIKLASLESTYGSILFFLEQLRRDGDPWQQRPLFEISTDEEDLLLRKVRR